MALIENVLGKLFTLLALTGLLLAGYNLVTTNYFSDHSLYENHSIQLSSAAFK